MKAMIFGGEGLKSGRHVIDIVNWDKQSITQAFIDYGGEEWANQLDGTMDYNSTMIDSVNIVNNRIAQCTEDSEDGGFIYLVLLD